MKSSPKRLSAVFAMLALTSFAPAAMGLQVVFTNSTTWVCPLGVTNIQVECWGGGGGAGGVNTSAQHGSGGGGAGGYARKNSMPVTPTTAYTITIPAAAGGGDTSPSPGTNGAAVSFTGDGGKTVTAYGGIGGGAAKNGSGTNGPALTTGGTGGDAYFVGGAGAAGTTTAGGGGGSGPSDLANGTNGTTTGIAVGATGSDSVHNGGAGGNCRGSNGNGAAPTNLPGGGGGGGRGNNGGTQFYGGAGAVGQIILSWTAPTNVTILGPPACYFVSDSNAPNYNLTTTGTQDWQIYGDASGNFNLYPSVQKTYGNSIHLELGTSSPPCNLEQTNQRSVQTYTWTSGDPTLTGTNVDAENNGFNCTNISAVSFYDNYETVTFTPGDTGTHVIHLYGYVAGDNSGVTLQFSNFLAGAAATVFTTNPPPGDFDYSISFQANDPNAALTVVWTFSQTNTTGSSTYLGLQAAAMSGTPTPAPTPGLVNWRVIPADTNYPTPDLVLAGVEIGDVINGTNTLPANQTNTDCAPYFQAAMNWLSSQGGGTVFVPPGQYCFSNSLSIPQGVTLRGRWVQPGPNQAAAGTIFAIYAGAGNTNAPSFIDHCGTPSSVRDLTFWYPNQNPTNPVYYPYTFNRYNRDLTTLRDLTLVNAYLGIHGVLNDMDAIGIYATTLLTGFDGTASAEVPRIENLHLAPDYWVWSRLPGAPTNTAPLAAFMLTNTSSIGIEMDNVGGMYMANCSVSGYCYGFLSTATFTGGAYGLTVTNCTEALRVTFLRQFSLLNSTFSGTTYGLHRLAGQIPDFYGCTIAGGVKAVMDENNGAAHPLQMDNCTLTGVIDMGNRGSLTMRSSRFTTTGINILPGTLPVQVVGAPNANCGPANVQVGGVSTNDPNSYRVTTNGWVAEPTLSSFPFTYGRVCQPAQAALFNVQSLRFAGGATGNGVTDDTAAIQAAIYAAETNGGGIVFFPPGNYVVTSPLVVSNGVELRGILDLWTQKISYPGSTIEVETGMNSSNGAPFLTLKDQCGIRGLAFNYPAQIGSLPFVPFPYMVQCAGMSNYLIYVSCNNDYQGVDVNGGQNAMVDYGNINCIANPYRIRGGATNCLLQHIESFVYGNSYGMIGDVFVAEDCTNLMIFETYTHLMRSLLVMRGGSVQALGLSGEQLQRGYVLESGSGALSAWGCGCKVDSLGNGLGGYDFWLETNYTGTVTVAASQGMGGSILTADALYGLRVDNPNASFNAYSLTWTGSGAGHLWDLQTSGQVNLVACQLGQCSLNVPAGGQLNVSASALGSLPYVPQAGAENFNTNNCVFNPSFIAADLDEVPYFPDGMTLVTNNLAPVVAMTAAPGTNPLLTNTLMIDGWQLAGGSNFLFYVTDTNFTKRANPNVSISLSYSVVGNGSLTVSYDSLTGMKTGATYAMYATNTGGVTQTFAVTDARFSGTNVADIRLTVSGQSPVVSSVAVYATNFLGVPPQLSSPHYAGPPPLITWSGLAQTNLVLAGTAGLANGGLTYWVRSATNLALPLSQWDWLATNVFNPDGSFSNGLPRRPGDPQRFYRLQTQ